MAADPLVYKWLPALLYYSEADVLDALPEFQTALDEWSELAAERVGLQAPLDHLERHSLCELQEGYVLVSDHSRRHALYIFKHVHDEDRGRGSAMMDLLKEYRRYGFELGDDRLPGYLPVLLEFSSHVPPTDAQELLGDAVYVIAHIAGNLQNYGSPYAVVLKAAAALSPVASQPLIEPPVRGMGEAMETFGPGWQGTEPLLKPSTQTMRFYSKGRH